MSTRRLRLRRPGDHPTSPAVTTDQRVYGAPTAARVAPGTLHWAGPLLVVVGREDLPQHPGQLQLPGTGGGGR